MLIWSYLPVVVYLPLCSLREQHLKLTLTYSYYGYLSAQFHDEALTNISKKSAQFFTILISKVCQFDLKSLSVVIKPIKGSLLIENCI